MPQKLNDKPQIDRFKEAARELGCDESEAAFDEKLGKITHCRPIMQPVGDLSVTHVDSDGLPPSEIIRQELVRVLSEKGRSVEPKEIYLEIAKRLNITQDHLNLKRRTRNESLWQNRVQAVRDVLVKDGFLENRRRGFWSLTKEGEAYAKRLNEPFEL